MIHLADIHPLTEFLRNHKQFVERLKTTRRPEVLTINGKAELVVQDAESYQKLLDMMDRIEAIEGIRRGLEEMERGEGRPAREFFAELRRKLNMPPRS